MLRCSVYMRYNPWSCVKFSTWCFGKTFVNSLKKFISRRDCPRIILSDIGTAFIAELTQNFAAICNIKWKISLTEAPWFGGFWERLVSPAKRSMKETLRNSTECFNELQVLLYEIKLVSNSRPLGSVYDNNLGEIFTPHHLLFGRKLYTCNSSIQDNVEIIRDVITWIWWKIQTSEWHKTIDKRYSIWRKTTAKLMHAWASSRTYKWTWWQNEGSQD